jgi:hypothetical protein
MRELSLDEIEHASGGDACFEMGNFAGALVSIVLVGEVTIAFGPLVGLPVGLLAGVGTARLVEFSCRYLDSPPAALSAP